MKSLFRIHADLEAGILPPQGTPGKKKAYAKDPKFLTPPTPVEGFTQEQCEHAAQALGVEPHVARAWLFAAPAIVKRDARTDEERERARDLRKRCKLTAEERAEAHALHAHVRKEGGETRLAELADKAGVSLDEVAELQDLHARSGLTEGEAAILDRLTSSNHPSLRLSPQAYVDRLVKGGK